MSDHHFPHGSIVLNYQDQLSWSGHKFGKHKLSAACPCRPHVSEDGKTLVHNEIDN
ncbi:hypothetical protein [Mycobacterium phage Azrael100]|nr:hypothetical protein [Mycobacterium phage Azrael100]